VIVVLAAAELEDAGQLKHVLSAESPGVMEYLPAMQPVQVLSVVVEYLPASQWMHEAAPVTVLNFPASHATHVPPFGPVWPASHRQLVIEAVAPAELEDAGQLAHVLSAETPSRAEYLPVMQPVQVLSAEPPGDVEYLPAPQSMHEAAPVTTLNFPASHATHVPPFGPVCPALHRQLVTAVLAAAELEDAGQLKHVLSAEAPPSAEYLPAMQPLQVLSVQAPGVVEYLPAPQSMHEVAPVTVLNFPAPHATHGPQFGPVWPASH
jgi:hypothetical protein